MDFTTVIILTQIIALIGFFALAPILLTMWRTTDAIIYCLLATLVCALCGFISVMGIYSWIEGMGWAS